MARTAKYLSHPPIYDTITLDQCGDVLTVEDLSRLLKKGNDSITYMCRRGDLPGIQIGKSWYVKKSDFIEMFTKRNAP